MSSSTPSGSPTSTLPAVRSARAWAAQDAASSLAPFSIERREPLADDVVIEILFCGVCHSDLHQVRNEWQGTMYPIVPGHEIVGRVTAVGSAVTRFKEGDLAAVGCLVASCQQCAPCTAGLEQYCARGAVQTYNGPDAILGGPTFGGYSERITVKESFTLQVSDT